MGWKRYTIRRSSRAVFAGIVVAAAVGFRLVGYAWAGDIQTNQWLENVSRSPQLREDIPEATAQTNALETAVAGALLRDDVFTPTPKSSTSADRWVRFQQEYGLERQSPSAVGRMLQAAKYGLDTMCFAAQETARKLEFRYDFWEESPSSFGSGMAQPEYSLPMFGRFGHAQLKSEVTVHDAQTGEAFIGLKLSIPFGPGGRGSSRAQRGSVRRGESNG
jgi:hypothetical protein